MNERDRKDTHDSIKRYLATGEANHSPACPTLEKGLQYYRYSAAKWLWDMNWRLREVALIATGAVIATCLETVARIYLTTGRNYRIRESSPGSHHDHPAT